MEQRARFGRARYHRKDVSFVHRQQHRLLGIGDPAHYLRSLYFREALSLCKNPINILDAGCGQGDYTIYLADKYPSAKIDSIDVSETLSEKQELAKKMGLENVFFSQKSILDIDKKDYYDFICCIDVLEHIECQEEAIRALANALTPEGILYIHMPAVRFTDVPFSKYLVDFQDWAKDEHIGQLHSLQSLRELYGRISLNPIYYKYTFGYYAGELANSFFMLFYRNNAINTFMQGLLILPCRILAYLDYATSRKIGFGLMLVAKRSPV